MNRHSRNRAWRNFERELRLYIEFMVIARS